MSLVLPPNPSLEHLRNQAKALLKACRAGDPGALARFEAVHQSAHSASHQTWRLSDTLFIIAREYGFASWSRLKAHVESIAELSANRELTGTVLGADRQPISGAIVTWIELTMDHPAPRVRSSTRSDDRGHFALPMAGADFSNPYLNTILAQGADGQVGFESALETPLSIALLPHTDLQLTMMDEDRVPVANLSINVARMFRGKTHVVGIPSEMRGLWSATTDRDGRCVISGLPRGVRVRLAYDDETWAAPTLEDEIDLNTSDAAQTAAVRLLRGGTIEGRVVRADNGTPVAGVRVAAQGAVQRVLGGTATTDADGKYRITQLGHGFYNVALLLDRKQEQQLTACALEKVQVRRGEHLKDQDFALIEGSIITGRVTDRLTGRPIPGVSIGIYGPARPRSSAMVQSAVTDSEGTYRACVPPGQQFVYVLGRGPTEYLAPPPGVDITLGERSEIRQDFTLTPTPENNQIQVRAQRVSGEAIANEQLAVQLRNRDGFQIAREITASTDVEGRFALTTREEALQVSAQWVDMRSTSVAGTVGGEPVTLVMRQTTQLTGRIVDSDGQPVGGATLTLVEWRDGRGASRERTRADGFGCYSFDGVIPGASYSVAAEAPGYGQNRSPQTPCESGACVSLPDIVLPIADRALSGRVQDQNGSPVAKQGVLVQGRKSKPQETITDELGRFSFGGIVDEALTLHLRADDGMCHDRTKAYAGEEDVVIIRTY